MSCCQDVGTTISVQGKTFAFAACCCSFYSHQLFVVIVVLLHRMDGKYSLAIAPTMKVQSNTLLLLKTRSVIWRLYLPLTNLVNRRLRRTLRLGLLMDNQGGIKADYILVMQRMERQMLLPHVGLERDTQHLPLYLHGSPGKSDGKVCLWDWRLPYLPKT
jgi:hypothetical protein